MFIVTVVATGCCDNIYSVCDVVLLYCLAYCCVIEFMYCLLLAGGIEIMLGGMPRFSIPRALLAELFAMFDALLAELLATVDYNH